jgi:hypothetical protein
MKLRILVYDDLNAVYVQAKKTFLVLKLLHGSLTSLL